MLLRYGFGDASTWSIHNGWNNLWNESMPEQIPNKTVLYPSIKKSRSSTRRGKTKWLFLFAFSSSLSADNVRSDVSQADNLICDLIKVVRNTNMHKECYSITFTERVSSTRGKSFSFCSYTKNSKFWIRRVEVLRTLWLSLLHVSLLSSKIYSISPIGGIHLHTMTSTHIRVKQRDVNHAPRARVLWEIFIARKAESIRLALRRILVCWDK